MTEEAAAPGRAAGPAAAPAPRRRSARVAGARAGTLIGLALGSTFYFVATGRVAAARPLWTDEIMTFHLARLPRWADMWAALSDGPDASAPLHHAAVRVLYGLLGEGELATRLPAIVGVWLMAVCLFAFVARRCGAAFAWAAMLLPLTTTAYTYAYEGRPYALWLGLSALGLLCWQAAGEGAVRAAALVGLAASLAGAMTCHYYTVLVLVALGLGELARSWARRSIDLLCWLALGAGLVPLAFLRPLMANARALAPNFWAPPFPRMLVYFFPWLLAQALPGLAAAAVLYALGAEFLRRRPGRRPEPPRAAFPAHEVVAAAGLVAMPGFAMALALTLTNAFANRYALPAVIGCGALLAALASHLEERTLMARALAVGLGLWFAVGVDETIKDFSGQIPALRSDLAALQGLRPAGGTVVACPNAHVFLMAQHYAPEALRPDLAYLAGFGDTANEPGVRKLVPWVAPRRAPRIAELDDLLARPGRFLMLTSPTAGLHAALRERLRSRGARVELVEIRGKLAVYAVSPAAGGASRAAGRP